MKRIQTLFNIVLFVLMLLIIQNVISFNNFQSKNTELELKISTLEYKNFELSEQVKKIKFKSVIWSANDE